MSMPIDVEGSLNACRAIGRCAVLIEEKITNNLVGRTVPAYHAMRLRRKLTELLQELIYTEDYIAGGIIPDMPPPACVPEDVNL